MGKSLAQMAPKSRSHLAMQQKQETPKTRKASNVLTVLTFFSATGKAIQDLIQNAAHPFLYFFDFSMHHWEFALCDMRKVTSSRARPFYRSQEEVNEQEQKFVAWRPVSN